MDDLDKLINKQRKGIKDFDKKLSSEEVKLQVALQIAELRRKSGLSQKEFAEKLQSKQSVISRIENGNQNITVEMLYKVADAFNKKLHLRFI